MLLACAFLLLAIAMTGASTFDGYSTDDHFFRAVFRGTPDVPELARGPLQSFVFADGDPRKNESLRDMGMFPWWAVTHAKLAFFRPLASAYHWLDYRLWNDRPAPMHAENVALYAVLCVLAFLLYRQLFDSLWVAALAAFVFTVNDGNGSTVGWISSRNTLMATICCVLVLIAHDAWRKRRSLAYAVAAGSALATGLLCGEATLSVGAYLLAYALFLEQGTARQRMLTLVPYGIIATAYLIAYRWAGYGSAGSGWYTDPGSDPLGFAAALAFNLPILLFTLWAAFPTPIFAAGPTLTFVLSLVVLSLLGCVIVLLVPLLRANPSARFWLLGSIIAIIPVCSVIPQPRVLIVASIGGAAIVAQYLSAWMDHRQCSRLIGAILVASIAVQLLGRLVPLGYALLPIILTILGAMLYALFRYGRRTESWLPAGTGWRIGAGALASVWVTTQLIVAPNSLPNTSRSVGTMGRRLNEAYASLPADSQVADQTLVVLQTPNDFMSWYFTCMRLAEGQPLPRHTRVLSASLRDLSIERTDERTIVLRTENGFVGNRGASIYRDGNSPMSAGEKVNLSGVTVEVLRTDDQGWPLDARFAFDRPLEDPALLWYAAAMVPVRRRGTGRVVDAERYVRVPLPTVGETARVAELVDRSPDAQAYRDAAADSARPADS